MPLHGRFHSAPTFWFATICCCRERSDPQASMLCFDVGNSTMNTSKEMRACRALLGWEQKDLAEASGVHRSTIQRMERFGRPHWSATNAAKVRQALENGGIIFIKS